MAFNRDYETVRDAILCILQAPHSRHLEFTANGINSMLANQKPRRCTISVAYTSDVLQRMLEAGLVKNGRPIQVWDMEYPTYLRA